MTDINQLDKLNYCINCQDAISGERGTFAYHTNVVGLNGSLRAISPVFSDVDEFYT